jgi:hypothetical protein
MDHMRRLVAGLLVLSVAAVGVAACDSMNGGGKGPAASQPVSPQVYPVFFVGHSVELTQDGHKIVATAARAAKEMGVSMVQLSGPSTQVTPHYDPGLAAPRIKLIEDELVADGVAREKIVLTSLPTDKVQVDTSGAQRVEIRVLK